MANNCPFCSSSEHSGSYLPDTHFAGKTFSYISCKQCELIFLDPFPTAADYVAMYPPSYQSGINNATIEGEKKLPGLRFPYSKHFEIINKFSPGKKMMDYGCGQANFVINANHQKFECDGVEYNPVHIEILKKEIPGRSFYLIDDFLKNTSVKYDVIRLSNVLEHLDDPAGIIQILSNKLNPNGILLIEGPIETNPSLALFFRKMYFKMAKSLRKKKASHPPTHIFFSNAVNQRNFFEKNGLKEMYFEVTECEWPFPENFGDVNSAGTFVKWMIAKTSIALRGLGTNKGNTFIYAGKRLS